jgi:phosphoribosylglycinamide formyltransferase-1
MPSTCKLGVLLSGRGSNFQAIWAAQQRGDLPGAELACVVSNRKAAGGLDFARAQGIPAYFLGPKAYGSLEAYDAAILEHLQAHGVDWLVLAGYTKIISPVLLSAYPGRILNIHPSLLPQFGGVGMMGEAVHAAVLAAGETETGATVHLVTEEVDGGPILGQIRVPVLPTDTVETLAARVLEQEHQLYPQVIRNVVLQQVAGPSQ